MMVADLDMSCDISDVISILNRVYYLEVNHAEIVSNITCEVLVYRTMLDAIMTSIGFDVISKVFKSYIDFNLYSICVDIIYIIV